MGDNMSQPVEQLPTVSESTKLTLSPEQTEAINRLVQTVNEVCERIFEVTVKLAEWVSEVIGEVAAALTLTVNDFMDRLIYEANANPRWWLLYRHAKKHRTRKKYRRLLMKQLLSQLRAAPEQEA